MRIVMRRSAPWLIALLAVMGCLWLADRERNAQDAVLRLTQENAAQGRQLQESHLRLAELDRKYAAAAAALTQGKATPKAADSIAAAAAKDPSHVVIHMHDLIRQYPEMEGIWRRQIRRGIITQYGAALADLNLSPDQLAKVKDLLVERQVSPNDAADAASQMGVQPGTPEMAKAMQQAGQAVEDEIKGLIGPDAYAALNNGNNSYMLQNASVDMQDAGIALSPAQTRAMAQTLADASNSLKNPQGRQTGYYQPDPQTNLTPMQQGVLQHAAGVLS